MPSEQVPFSPTTEDDWRRLAGASAARAPVTDDQISIPPIATRRAEATPIVGKPGWRIIQRLTGEDADSVAREAAEAIAGGADGIEIVFETSFHPLRSRLPIAAARRLGAALADLPTRDVLVRIDAGDATSAAIGAFAETSDARALLVSHDLIAATAVRWADTSGIAGRIVEAAALTKSRAVRAFASADGRLWHAAGATDTQELAAALATVVALVRHAGPPTERTPGATGVALAADVDPFRTIAKFRAARLLLLRLAELLGTPSIPIIHAETAWRMLSRREPRTNVLRSTTAALAAAAGGADTITVLPNDAALDACGADAARLARNTQSILAAEARLGAVADPGAGSGAIEALTDALAEAAWQKFQAIESAGGIIAEIVAGSLQKEIAAARRARQEGVARGEVAMVGVNTYVDGEAGTPAPVEEGSDAVLAFTRLAEAFETSAEVGS